MKKTLLFLLALLGCLGAQADQKRVIRVATDQTDLLLQVGDNGRLYQTYLGPKLRHEADSHANTIFHYIFSPPVL